MMGRRILIVDDEEDIRTVLTQMLSHQGFEVDAAQNGQQALDKLSEGEYQLMVLDIMMPVMDGFTLLDKLDARTKDQMPIVVLTAKASDADVLKGYSIGASYYVVKPFDNVTLLNAILFMLGDLSEEEMESMHLKL
jgi:two-component system response regulator ResD